MPQLAIDIEARFAKFQDALDQIERSAGKTARSIERAFGGMTTALAGIGIGLSVGGLAEFIRRGIDAEAVLHDMAIQTGITVETLSALREVAKLAGMELGDAATMVNKLQGNMLAFAQTGGGKAADAFRQLGFSQAEVREGLKNMDAFLPRFAERLIAVGVGGEKAGLAMQLIGKSGAQALPFLAELAAQGELVARVTKEQAALADEFQDNLTKLGEASRNAGMSLANMLLPSLTKVTQAMLDARRAGQGLRESLKEGAKIGFAEIMGWTTEGDLARVNEQLVIAMDKWQGLEKVQGTRGIRAERVAAAKAEVDRLVAQKNTLEAILKLEREGGLTGGGGKPEAKPLPALPNEQEAKRAAEELKRLQEEVRRSAERSFEEQYNAWFALEEAKAKVAQKAAAEERALLELGAKGANEAAVARVQAKEEELLVLATIRREEQDMSRKQAEEADRVFHELGLTFSSALGQVITAGGSARDVLQGLIKDVAQIILKITVLEPLADNLRKIFKEMSGGAGGGSGLFGGVLDKIFGGSAPAAESAGPWIPSDLPMFATGSAGITRSGLAWVDRGERVVPAGAAGSGVVVHQTINVDAGVAQTVRAEMLALLPAFKREAVAAVVDARRRGS